jgi:hypothetical protein
MVVVLVALLALPLAVHAQETDPVAVTRLMAEYLAAWDIDNYLSLFADDIVVTMIPGNSGPQDVYTGKAELRALLDGARAQNLEFEYEIASVEGDTVTLEVKSWMDYSRALGIAPIINTEVYTIRDGKIQTWTYTMSEESMAALAAAMAALPETGGGTLPIQGMLVGLGGLAAAGGLGLERLRRRSR